MCVLKKKDTLESFYLLFSPKKLVRLSIQKKVKPCPGSRMIKLPILRPRHYDIRDLTKLRRRRQLQKAIGLVSKTTILHEHHAFLYISLPSLHDYDVKWPNFFEDRNGKAIKSAISVWTLARPPLFSSTINSLLLSNWATWDNREMVCKDAESISPRSFHERSRCRIGRSLFSLKLVVQWRRLSRFPATMTLHGSRVTNTQYWEKLVLVVVLVSESKGP